MHNPSILNGLGMFSSTKSRRIDWILCTLKCMTNKITLNDLKMAEHLLKET
jgi:hypothetical protein